MRYELPPRNFEPRTRHDRLRSKAHRDFVRRHLCVLWARKDCEGPVDCCHARDLVPYYQRHGAKPDEIWLYPACRRHHRAAEKRELAFGEEYGLDMRLVCLEFALQSPDKAIREAAKAALAILRQGNQGDGQDRA